MTDGPFFLTTGEACDLLRISSSSLYRLTAGRRVPHVKIGGKLLFPKEKLLDWVSSQAVTS